MNRRARPDQPIPVPGGHIRGDANREKPPSRKLRAVAAVRPAVMPHAITSFGARRVGPWLYVFGGRAHAHTKDSMIDAFRRYNMVEGHGWQELPAGPALQGMALVATADCSIHRVGGAGARNERGDDADMRSTASVSRFDVATGKWQAMTLLPEAVCHR